MTWKFELIGLNPSMLDVSLKVDFSSFFFLNFQEKKKKIILFQVRNIRERICLYFNNFICFEAEFWGLVGHSGWQGVSFTATF